MKQVSREDLLNGWLKYHSTTVEEVIKKHPKEILESAEWFKLYPCTQEESDEWEKWAKEYTRKITKVSKKYLEQAWWSIYLNCSPYVKPKENE